MGERFVFVNFVPRKQIEIYANRVLAKVLEQMPRDSMVKAKAMRRADEFHFSVCEWSTGGKFNASSVSVPKIESKNRLWQQSAIDTLMDQLWDQIDEWRGANFDRT